VVKKYDFEKAEAIIEKEKGLIESASLGMQEDWFWTAETIFEEGSFTKELTNTTTIGGIDGSCWATPVLRINYVDGSEIVYECFTGESSGTNTFGSLLTSGPLSSEVQANMPNAIPYEKGKSNEN